MYDQVTNWEYVRNKELYEQINGKFIPYEENQQLQQWLLAAKAQTAMALQNLTQTMGVVEAINGQLTFLPLTEFYQRSLDSAVLDITSGAFDYNSVLKRTANTLSKSGIRTIDYTSGYTSRLPVAVRRAVMTGVSQLTGQIADMNAEELGTEYFEIDWHEGARPSHRKWQGRVWSRQELVSVCGLGTVTGLKGANCYHDYYPFIPGISERNYTDEELAELDRKEDIKRKFKGKEYNAYEARQKQRQMETSMRAQRQKVRMLEDGEADQQDIIIAKARYQGQLAEYKQFSDAMKLKPHMERVYIDGLGRVANSGKVGKSVNIQGKLATTKNLIYPKTVRRELGSIDVRKVDDAKIYFGNMIRNEVVENVVVIQKSGRVIHFIGEEKGASLYDVDLKGATIVHNHPSSEGIISFGEDDFVFLKANQNIRLLIAVNKEYNYSVEVLKDITKLTYTDLQGWGIPAAYKGEEMQHAIFEALAKRGYVRYEREKID